MLLNYRQEDVSARTAMYVSVLTLKERRRAVFLFSNDASNFSLISKFQNSNDVLRNLYWETCSKYIVSSCT
jgi:hypothetical protein